MSILIDNVSRRDALKTMGITAGFVLSASVVPRGLRALLMGDATGDLEPSVYLAIQEDGTVRVYVHRVEMGQGSRTGLTQIIADELEADWKRLRVMPAYGDKKFGSQNTDGSSSIRQFYDAFRTAGATARTMLERAAAARWGVDPSQVEARNHLVRNKVSGATLDYGALVAAAQALPVPAPESLHLKSKADFRYIGKPVKNVYAEEFVTGRAMFGQDIMRPGMVFAVAARPPVVGGKVTGYDKAAAMAVDGVIDVVELPVYAFPMGFQPLGGVAVVATNTWAAMQGRNALKATFDEGPRNGSYDTLDYEKVLWAAIDAGGRETYARGDVEAALASSARRLKADYFVPHQHHIPMEPPAAVAEWDGGKLSIWTSCQDPQAVQTTTAPFVGVAAEDIYVETTLLGGAFGRKSKPDFAVEAAVIAKAVGKPVKMVWAREDDVHHGFYHAISAQRVEVGLDVSGKIEAWDHRAAYPSLMEVAGGGEQPGAVDFELGPLVDQPLSVPAFRARSGDAP
ncbi:MAG: molybdopterin-dependent oxidoreductase, partial [Gemmatimonadota bacterium]